jgi:hypothetical protein
MSGVPIPAIGARLPAGRTRRGRTRSTVRQATSFKVPVESGAVAVVLARSGSMILSLGAFGGGGVSRNESS